MLSSARHILHNRLVFYGGGGFSLNSFGNSAIHQSSMQSTRKDALHFIANKRSKVTLLGMSSSYCSNRIEISGLVQDF